MDPTRDVLIDELLEKQRPYCPCEWMDSEDNLFLLYTSGSTGMSPCPAGRGVLGMCGHGPLHHAV